MLAMDIKHTQNLVKPPNVLHPHEVNPPGYVTVCILVKLLLGAHDYRVLCKIVITIVVYVYDNILRFSVWFSLLQYLILACYKERFIYPRRAFHVHCVWEVNYVPVTLHT